MSNMTFPCVKAIHLGPSPFNSAPQCKKSSLRHHFSRNSWKLGSQMLHVHAHFWCTCKFSFFPVFPFSQSFLFPSLPGAYLGKTLPLCPTTNTQKMTKNRPIKAKNGQKRTAENFVTTYLDPKSKNFAPFTRYGRLKSKFLCEQISHCISSFCSIELTKTRNTWSLTAVTGSC